MKRRLGALTAAMVDKAIPTRLFFVMPASPSAASEMKKYKYTQTVRECGTGATKNRDLETIGGTDNE